MAADATDLRTVFDVGVMSLVLTVHAALIDLKAAKGAVLVTNGGLGFFDPKVDAMAVHWSSMGLAISNAAKRKLIGLLSDIAGWRGCRLRAREGYRLWDTGSATIDPRTVADKFWEIYSTHQSRVVTVS